MEGIQLINENVKNFATFPWAKASKDVDPISQERQSKIELGNMANLVNLKVG
jgi:hypothetical protein